MVRERRREVFIASRFAELDPLRKELARLIAQLAPIDLNDESAGPKPPLSECLARVREADIMVLLLDESYGAPAPGHEKSFTHLEYEAAIREERPVLVYA